ncbi:MAG: L,D-transpeptidase [Selenomonadaceae bacterium]|nr:L,D-transpeptidase [Selenomonadaceae bacterium]
MRAFLTATLIISSLLACLITTASAEKKILINAASRILCLYDGNVRLRLYPVGLGKVTTPTPTGYYSILTKEIDPPWIDPNNPEYEVPSGANNPLGYRWMQIQGNYGIHGTNRPDSIGFYVSNGCVRMREADVEDLFDIIEVGTPVEITYNRVVVEKADDGNVVYYIYPDGYGQQALDVKYVNSWLIPWGVSAFADDREIEKEIDKSAGTPVYIGKPYSIELSGVTIPATEQNKRHFDNKAIERGGITYLPAVPIAIAMEMKLEWRHHTTLATKYGQVPGIEKKGQLYLNEDDASILFRVEGWKDGSVYKLKPLPAESEATKDNTTYQDGLDNQGTQQIDEDNTNNQTLSPVEDSNTDNQTPTETESNTEEPQSQENQLSTDDQGNTTEDSNTKKKGDQK